MKFKERIKLLTVVLDYIILYKLLSFKVYKLVVNDMIYIC